MYQIHFYRDKKGIEPVLEHIKKLEKKSDKNSRIKLNKIQEYIEALHKYGTLAGEPYIKHLEGKIWELRPLRDRILFAAWIDSGFVLLHAFMKETQKTPRREIMKAKKELADILERGFEDEK